MDQLRAVFAIREDVEHAINVTVALLGAALHGDPGGLVQGEEVIILIDDHFAHELLILGRGGIRLHGLFLRLGGLMDGGQAHDHARLKTVLRLGAAAIDADLSRAQQLFQLALRHREAAFHPAVEARALFLGADSFIDDLLAHASTFLITKRPRRTRARPATTERPA